MHNICLGWILCLVGLVGVARCEDVAALRTQLNGDDLNLRATAAAELAQLGPLAADAVPDLVKAATSDDLLLRHEAIVALGRIRSGTEPVIQVLARTLDDESPILRHSALAALRAIGPAAASAASKIKPLLNSDNPLERVDAAWAYLSVSAHEADAQAVAVPILLDALGHEIASVRRDAVLALSEVGPPVVKSVIPVLKSEETREVADAADVLGRIGPAAKDAVPALLQTLKRGNAAVQEHAAHALGEIAAEPKTVVPALTMLLNAENRSVRASAATALGQYGAEGAPAVTRLTRLLDDDNVNLRLAAARALGDIGSAAAPAVPRLAQALEEDVGAVTLEAADALAKIGKASVPALTEKLKVAGLRGLVASVLAQIGPAAKESALELVKYIDEGNRDTRTEVMLALAAIGPEAEAAVPVLMKKLQSDDEEGRGGAAYALAHIGAREAIPILKQTVKHPTDARLRLASAWALVYFEPENAAFVELAVPELKRGLQNESPLVRREAAGALAKIGPDASSAVPDLLAAAEDSNSEVRAEVLRALASIDPHNEKLPPIAMKLLDDPDVLFRRLGMYLLGRMGPAAKAAVPALESRLNSRSDFEATVAAWALVQVSPEPRFIERALPLLIAAAERPNPDVRAEVARTLGRIGAGRADVMKTLRTLAQDEDEAVRNAAEAALSNIRN